MGEVEDDAFWGDAVVGDGELGDDGVLVLDFDGDFGVGEVGGGFGENTRDFLSFEAVIEVVTEPDLELAGGEVAEGSAAVEEGFLDASDFGDVEGLGDGIARWEDELE